MHLPTNWSARPLLELVHIEKENDPKARVLGNLEYFHPGGQRKGPHGESDD